MVLDLRVYEGFKVGPIFPTILKILTESDIFPMFSLIKYVA